MKQFTLPLKNGQSKIFCGEGALSYRKGEFANKKLFVITDSTVFALYEKLIKELFGDSPVYVFPAGERSKTPKTLFNILNAMLNAGLKRCDTAVALGGGVVGDIAGLAASLYMRGTDLIQIPTTLLAQVDSSVGGKTAVDMGNVKNAVGSFYQPQTVIADQMFLKTLPARQINCGLGEIVKYAAIDKNIYLRTVNAESIKNKEFFYEIIPDCICCKAEIVKKDESDLAGIRKVLNLGHTTGHAFELYYGKKSHGEYVLEGMWYELYISQYMGICTDKEYARTLKKLITSVIKLNPRRDIQNAVAVAKHDKKNTGEEISLIVPESVGKCAEIKLNEKQYTELLMQCTNDIKGETL